MVKSLHKRPWLGAEPVSGTNITSIIKPGHPAAAKQRASARCFCVSCAVALPLTGRRPSVGELSALLIEHRCPKHTVFEFALAGLDLAEFDLALDPGAVRFLRRFSGYVRYAGRVRAVKPKKRSLSSILERLCRTGARVKPRPREQVRPHFDAVRRRFQRAPLGLS